MNLTNKINKNIFREYDIRGIYPVELNEDVSYTIGRSFGTYLKKYNSNTCLVGYDNRLSNHVLSTSLMKGLTDSGVDPILVVCFIST